MLLKYLGTHPVDIPGHDYVAPGAVVDVADEVGASLLVAGASFADSGELVALPENPLWEAAKAPASKKADPADDKKES